MNVLEIYTIVLYIYSIFCITGLAKGDAYQETYLNPIILSE